MTRQNDHWVALVDSYIGLVEGDWEACEKALRTHARQFGGCISCIYSRMHPEGLSRKGNPWYMRTCILGLKQDTCGMHEDFPELGKKLDKPKGE